MKRLTGLACPNKWCSRETGSPEPAVSGIWFVELTQPKGNKSCHVNSKQRKVGSAALTEANRRSGRRPGGQDAWPLLGLSTLALLPSFSLALDPSHSARIE